MKASELQVGDNVAYCLEPTTRFTILEIHDSLNAMDRDKVGSRLYILRSYGMADQQFLCLMNDSEVFEKFT